MASTQNILSRIFANRTIPTDASQDEFHRFFEQAVGEFEDSGFLQANKLPELTSEEDFLDKLHQHRSELMVLEFWKRSCIPCLSMAEMYKAAEQEAKKRGIPVHFYSVNIHDPKLRDLVDHQLVEGTPTVQVYHKYTQVGDEVRAVTLDTFLRDVQAHLPPADLGDRRLS